MAYTKAPELMFLPFFKEDPSAECILVRNRPMSCRSSRSSGLPAVEAKSLVDPASGLGRRAAGISAVPSPEGGRAELVTTRAALRDVVRQAGAPVMDLHIGERRNGDAAQLRN